MWIATEKMATSDYLWFKYNNGGMEYIGPVLEWKYDENWDIHAEVIGSSTSQLLSTSHFFGGNWIINCVPGGKDVDRG